MSITYGYARCSTDINRQDIDRQKRELRILGVLEDKHIFWEYGSGIKEDRIELLKLLDIVQNGDTIASTEVSRLTRSTKQLCEILQLVQEKHLCLVIGSFVVDCRSENIDPMTKGMLMMWGVFAEMERDIISQRVKSGMANARIKGKRLGRPISTIESIPSKFFQYYPLYLEEKLSITDFAGIMKCSRTTIYKYVAMMKRDEKARKR